ncbi:hypothetical protein GSI_06060 [Ganoderma sinense ZZ0214-1]|uniref:Uncharacterized protein n=1 Tax=Ganoderma sinense ZZ0214-1 TaxID=1077348 RepID=A0A2G8SC86_9APHY|nr:hypothetical protein GSI_06060 [Ganoderma sinense ZZ0214-1]
MPPQGSSSAQAGTSKGAKRHHPYNDKKRAPPHNCIPEAGQVSSRSTPSSSTSAALPTGVVRDSFLEVIRDKHPWFKPRNDFDIYTVVNYQGAPDDVWTWLDGQLALLLAAGGNFDGAMAEIRRLLDTPRAVADVTGIKPKPGSPNVFVRPIPNSEYSVRLFPGSLGAREYCMDFVLTSTGEPVNSPFKFDLWTVPSTTTPWLGGMSMRVYSMEKRYGHRDEDIVPGVEKFLLRDGQTCLLRRPGHRDLRFTVPIRAAAMQAASAGQDADEIDFPEII